jgi:DNA-binding SARP family transcriptional activator
VCNFRRAGAGARGLTLLYVLGIQAGRATHRHRLAMLALLALAPAQRLSRDKLIAYLWPESDSQRGRNLLNVSTYVLRTELGESALLSAGDDLRLNAEVVQADVAEFEAALERADHVRAVALYRGPFLDAFFLSEAAEFEEWADRTRERLAGCS